MLSALPKKILNRVSGHILDTTGLLRDVGLKTGQTVLELGSPVGFFTAAALHEVGSDGAVYVAGPTTDSLEKFIHYSEVGSFHGVLLSEVLAGTAAPLQGIDVVILTNLLSNTMKPGEYCLSINQYLKPDGEVILIDWDQEAVGAGVASGHGVTREQAIKILTSCGLEFTRSLHALGYHYGLVFHFDPTRDNLETA